MASDGKQLQYIVLDDFSPGIWDNWYAKGNAQSAPNGAATLNGTFSCCSGPNNALIPAPKPVQSMLQTAIDGPPSGANAYMFADAQMHVLDFRVFSPISQTITGGQSQPPFPDQVWINWSWFLITNSPTNTAMTEKSLARTYFTYLCNSSGVAQYPFGTFNPAAPNIYDAQAHTNAMVVASPTTAQFPHGIATFDHTRANVATPTNFGTPETIMSHFFGNAAGGVNNAFPDNATPTLNSVHNTNLPTSDSFIFCHQDRSIGLRTGFSAGYGVNGFGPSSEIMDFTNVNDYTNSTNAGLVLVSEHPTGYGSWVSMNASTLMLIKQRGGGVLVSGALEQPTVTYMPGIPSTLGATNRGALSPNGTYIYGTSRGVYEWSGGDSANLISPQFDGWFWRPVWNNGNGTNLTDKRLGLYGSFCYVTPYVFCPNNFIYDPRTGGWWLLRQGNVTGITLQNSITYAFWDVSANGLAVGCAAAVDTGSFDVAVDWYDTNQGQIGYQWQSHPLAESVNRELDFREINITVTCPVSQCLVNVQLSSTLQTGASIPLTFNNIGVPYTVSIPYETRAHDVQLTITANSSNLTDPGPIIHRVELGYQEREMAR